MVLFGTSMTVQMHATIHSGERPSQSIYVLQEGIYLGPYTEKEVRRHWANGTIRDADLLWQEGMNEWMNLRSYFGMPTPMITETLTGKVPSNAPPRQPSPVIPLSREAPDFYYQGHPALAASWLIFFSWSCFGASMLAAAIFYQKPALVGMAAGVSVIVALLHLIRLRSASSVGLLVASVVMPALVWCLAVALLPEPKSGAEPKAKTLIINPIPSEDGGQPASP